MSNPASAKGACSARVETSLEHIEGTGAAVTTDMGSTDAGADAKPPRPGNRKRVLLIAVVALVVLIPAIVGSMIYTERPQFCPVCHEMSPYYAAWTAGAHKQVSCVDCHVDPGVVNHGLHKFVALKELWDHFTTKPVFPNYTVELPNARCIACHPKVKDTLGAKFSHALHATKAQCRDCHMTVGHLVTLDALDAVGVLRPAATAPPAPKGIAPSSAPGHIKVACQRCHDQAKMRCALCHKAPHEVKPGDCSACHAPGPKFVFIHTTDTDCAKCHKPPAKHFPGACVQCHKGGLPSWVFNHPASNACASCHKAPANHFGAGCASCHRVGVAFRNATFRHPGGTGEHSYRSFACAKCHPKGYGSASCTCHGGRAPSGD
jgi:nitrate/TMAO reductase-like tetraheme cytochrome c subunit